jgi:myo-inositol-1-phosphate synthase
MPRIRVGIIGTGNVASAFTQSLLVRNMSGIWHKRVGGYEVKDIEIVAAFDIDKRKQGMELSEAVFRLPNVGPKFAKIPKTQVFVKPGIMLDVVPQHLIGNVESSDSIVHSLREYQVDVALNLIPSGMPKSSTAYAKECLEAGVSFVNATPSLVAAKTDVQRKFKKSRLVVAGDDLMSQFGGTAFHKGILDFINNRGIEIKKSYQLDVGGGNETLNTISEDIKLEKRDIKTAAIAVELPYKFATVAGTTDYVDYMGNNRTSYFWLAGKGAFDSEIAIDVYLRTNDGANAVNVILDVVRAVYYSSKHKRFGAVAAINEYGFKKLAKPVQLHTAHADFCKQFVR